MSPKEILDKAYGSMPKEVGWRIDIFDFGVPRSLHYYWLKLVRKLTR